MQSVWATVRTMTSPVERIGRRLAWREAGVGGTPVVFLHGLGGSRLAWEPQLAALAGQCRAVAWDMPGYGRSATPTEPLTFASLAAAVIELADDLGADRINLVGLSLGGMIAQYTAAAYPARLASLTLLSTSPKFGLDGTLPADWRAARLAPLDAGQEPIDFADRVLGAISGPHMSAEALAHQRIAMAEVTGEAMRRAIDCIVTHDSRDLLSTITVPTRCLVGELDDETPPAYCRYIADRIPGARLDVIPGAGHLLSAEAPDVVNRLLIEHIQACT